MERKRREIEIETALQLSVRRPPVLPASSSSSASVSASEHPPWKAYRIGIGTSALSQGREQSACRSTSAFSSAYVTYCTVGQEVPWQTRHYRYMNQFHRVARGPITEREAHRQQLWPYRGVAPRNHQPLAGRNVLVATAKLAIPGTLVTLMASASTMTIKRTAPAPVVQH